jgi:hypothetical protein
MMCRIAKWPAAVLLVGLALAPHAAAAATGGTGDWPCVQRLVPEIAAGMIWAGPPLDEVTGATDDPELDRLAAELAARRVPLEEAEQQVAAFAAALESDARNQDLARLFARTLAIINQDRASIIGGIKRFARGQQALADKIAAQNAKLHEVEPQQVLERDALVAERDWDIRIYDDRQSSLVYLCEQPVLLEQRAFALARAIASHLE